MNSLPPKGGSFEPLPPARQAYGSKVKSSSWARSSKSCSAIYCMMTSSVTLPELAAKYPRPHRWRPQNCPDKRRFSASSLREVFPFMRPTNLLTEICGGSETNRCTRSLETCPFKISISMDRHISRIRSRKRTATSPKRTGLRYLVIHTIWTLTARWKSRSSAQCE